MAQSENYTKPIDKFIPWMIVLFFVVIFAVNAVFVIVAMETHPGTVTENPYEKGLDYSKAIEATREQNKLGWKSRIVYQDGVLKFTLSDAKGNALPLRQARAVIMRPVRDGFDQTIQLNENGMAPVKFPIPGVWRAHVYCTVNGRPYQVSRTLSVE